jgi:hypothetical protein
MASRAKSACNIRDILLRSKLAVLLEISGRCSFTKPPRRVIAKPLAFLLENSPHRLTSARGESLGPALGRPAGLAQGPPVLLPSARGIDSLGTG